MRVVINHEVCGEFLFLNGKLMHAYKGTVERVEQGERGRGKERER